MLRKRALQVQVVKPDKTKTPETSEDDITFEQKTEFVLRKLESVGAKMFLGFCAYIVLDTHRQVAIAKAMRSAI